MGGDQTRATLAGDVALHPELETPTELTGIGHSVVVTGDVSADEPIIVEGRIDGRVTVPDHGVSIGEHGTVTSDVVARTITVRGTASGKLTATERLEILATGRVQGRLVTPLLTIEEGAVVNATVDPKKIDAAVAVGRHRLKQHTNPDSD